MKEWLSIVRSRAIRRFSISWHPKTVCHMANGRRPNALAFFLAQLHRECFGPHRQLAYVILRTVPVEVAEHRAQKAGDLCKGHIMPAVQVITERAPDRMVGKALIEPYLAILFRRTGYRFHSCTSGNSKRERLHGFVKLAAWQVDILYDFQKCKIDAKSMQNPPS